MISLHRLTHLSNSNTKLLFYKLYLFVLIDVFVRARGVRTHVTGNDHKYRHPRNNYIKSVEINIKLSNMI